MTDIIYRPLDAFINRNFKLNILEEITRQYLLLLSNLTVTTPIGSKFFYENICKICTMGTILVAIKCDKSKLDDKCKYHDGTNFEIVATGTLIVEPKIIRGGHNVGHIEDVVVSPNMRRQGISQEILTRLTQLAKDYYKCYKVILDCDTNVKDVYIKNGFETKGIQMVKYFT